MPRGSKPGERRGGRQRGTPNKKTVLKNAAILAAAGKSYLTPLEFLLSLMRDPNLPTRVRIEMAAAAAPFAPLKPRTSSRSARTSVSPSDANGQSRSDSTVGGMERKLNTNPPSGLQDLSPVDYLLSVMTDPDIDPRLQIKAARLAARFVHRKRLERVYVDEYGFPFDLDTAKKIRDNLDRFELYSDEPSRGSRFLTDANQLAGSIECPAEYSGPEFAEDKGRLEELRRKRGSNPSYALSPVDDEEEAYLRARSYVYELRLKREGQLRIKKLQDQKEHGPWSEALQSELDRLKNLYDDRPPKPRRKTVEEAYAEFDSADLQHREMQRARMAHRRATLGR